MQTSITRKEMKRCNDQRTLLKIIGLNGLQTFQGWNPPYLQQSTMYVAILRRIMEETESQIEENPII